MPKLEDIESAAKALAACRDNLAQAVGELNDGMNALKRRWLPVIKRRVALAAERQAALRALLEDSADLFVKPRTVILHGVKVGWAKGKGRLFIADADKTVRLIERHLPELADTLIDTVKRPAKAAIVQLPAADLKRIGCDIEGTEDAVVIAFVDGEVDKMVDALLKDAIATEATPEAA